MRSLPHDLRFSVRALLKNPGFGFLAVITLALGITASTVTFSVLNSFRRPLPVQEPDKIVVISAQVGAYRNRIRRHSYPDYLEFRQHSADVMAGLAAYEIQPAFPLLDLCPRDSLQQVGGELDHIPLEGVRGSSPPPARQCAV